MDILEIVDSQGRRRRVGLDRPRLLIGREPSCDIYLPHPNVSRRHAQIQRTDQGAWMLQDLSSLNHVYVDNRPVQQIVLVPNKPVRIAEYRLALREATDQESDSGTTPQEQPTDAPTGLEPGWLEQLHVFQRGLLLVEEPRLVLERLAQEFQRIAQADLVAVGLCGQGPGQAYRWEVTLGVKPGAPTPPVLQEVGDRVKNDESDIQAWTLRNSADRPAATPSVCLLFPIKGRSMILGHVLVQAPRIGQPSAAVQRYLSLLTTHAGLVWDNFAHAAERIALREMEQELRQARQIQIELFPPTFEVDDRLDVFAVNLPSVSVSGDYYDLFRTGPDTVAFVIADAMGHGMPAAIMMAAVRAALRLGVTAGLPWPRIFQGLDDIIAQARGGGFVTGVLGQIDLARNELTLVSAGHPAPSVLSEGKAIQIPDECQTRPWGLTFDCQWQVGKMALGKNWSVLCFTDGITEPAGNSSKDGSTRLALDYHQRNCHLSAEDLCQGLLSEAAVKHRSESALGDDQTVLALCSARG